jgi:hypothetical protein
MSVGATIFWKFNISRKEHSFLLKLSGYSRDHKSYLWMKFQVEIHLFDLSAVPLPYVENLVKRTSILKEAIATQILLGFLLGHYVVFIDGVSLKSEGGTWGGSLVSLENRSEMNTKKCKEGQRKTILSLKMYSDYLKFPKWEHVIHIF